MSRLTINNPKPRGPQKSPSTWYRYYPCFSENFAQSVLTSAKLTKEQWVLDPWNGSGTTTSNACSLGLNTYGFDLNPVMILIAKARDLDFAEYPSVQPLLAEVVRKARKTFDVDPLDPLLTWLVPNSVSYFRSIEAAIQKLLVDEKCYLTLNKRGLQAISDLAAFFYLALFRTLKRFLKPFVASNPTWVKRPKHHMARLRPDGVDARATFRSEVEQMLKLPAKTEKIGTPGKRLLAVASSESLPLPDGTIDFALSSPPYCTRIDYAVATSIELAALGQPLGPEFEALRRQLIGNTTVPKTEGAASQQLGPTCLKFLEKLSKHAAKASSTYYYKNHIQYFRSIAQSLSELSRVLKPEGRCILVVQDSFYKDLHNDLPKMVIEMAHRCSLELSDRFDFPLSRTMAGINPRVSEYRDSFAALETVIVLDRTQGIRSSDNVAAKPVVRPSLES